MALLHNTRPLCFLFLFLYCASTSHWGVGVNASENSSSPSSSRCPSYPEAPLFRLIHPRNGTLYRHSNPVISTVRIDSLESYFPVELSLYRHASPSCTSNPSCGYGVAPELTHVATHVHEENNDLWLTHDWGTLEPGVYVMYAQAGKGADRTRALAHDDDHSPSTSTSLPYLSHYRSCHIWHSIHTFVVIHNDTVWKPHDQHNQTQVYYWRLLAKWCEMNGATGLHQFDMVLDPVTSYRSLRATVDFPSNSSILRLPLHIVLQSHTFVHDTPFLQHITSMDQFFQNITTLYELTPEQNSYLGIIFTVWCLAMEEQCYWIHFIRSWPHVDFYISSIAQYRTNGSIPTLSASEYRQHSPPLPLVWTDIEAVQWASSTFYARIQGVRKAHQTAVNNACKFMTSSVLSHLNLPPRIGAGNDSFPLHPFMRQFVTWSAAMRISRGWNQRYAIGRNYTFVNYTTVGAQMNPIMDLFDHHDELGVPVASDVDIPWVILHSPVNRTLSSGQILYDSYRSSGMTPMSALLYYGWILPESSHFMSITIQPLPPDTTVRDSVHARFNSAQQALTLLNIPSTLTFGMAVGSSLPPLFLFRLRLLFYEFELCRENPHTPQQLYQAFKHVNFQKQDIILSSASERSVHTFVRELIWTSVRLPEREQNPDKDVDKDKLYPIPPVGFATLLFNEYDENPDPTLGFIAPLPTSIPVYDLLPDTHYEQMLNDTHATYHHQALATFTLAERRISRHVLTVIDKHEASSNATP